MVNIYLELLTKNPWLQALTWVVGIAAGLAALYAVGRGVWRINRAVVQTVDLVNGLPARLTKIDDTLAEQSRTLAGQNDKIDEIHHETQKNDGSSIKDSQDRTEKQVKALTRSVDRLERSVKGLYDRADDSDANAAELRKDLEGTRPLEPVTTHKPPKERST